MDKKQFMEIIQKYGKHMILSWLDPPMTEVSIDEKTCISNITLEMKSDTVEEKRYVEAVHEFVSNFIFINR